MVNVARQRRKATRAVEATPRPCLCVPATVTAIAPAAEGRTLTALDEARRAFAAAREAG